MVGFDADRFLRHWELNVLTFTEEVFFDEGYFTVVINLLGRVRHLKYFAEKSVLYKNYKL